MLCQFDGLYTRFFWLMLVSAGLLSACRQGSTNACSIAFYNCENFFYPTDDSLTDDDEFTPNGKYGYDVAAFHRKTHRIAQVLQSLFYNDTLATPCLVGLAEIENEYVLQQLISQPELLKKGLKYVLASEPDHRGIRVALLYDPSAFTVVRYASLSVHYQKHGISEIVRSRNILAVTGILLKDTVQILVNHWPSQRGGNGLQGHEEAERAITSWLCAPGRQRYPTLVIGDFNELPIDSNIQRLRIALKEHDPLFMESFPDGTGTEYFDGKWNLFDHIHLYTPTNIPPKWKCTKAHIFNPDFLSIENSSGEVIPARFFYHSGNHGYSDHYPVIMELSHE